VLWLHHPGWVNDVRATFINHNSFATWVGLCLICALALFYQSATLRRNPAYRLPLEPLARLEQFLLGVWRPLLVVLVLSAALILSHSRGGFLSFVSGALVLLCAIQFRQPVRQRTSRQALWVAAGSLLLVFWISSEVLLERIDQLTADYTSRLNAYLLALDGIRDNPVLGYGYGAFAESMRIYRSEQIEGYFDMAHNTYLENIMELGWPFAACLLLVMGLLVSICWSGLARQRQWIFPALGLAASTLVAVHAMMDFSLQIPAVAMCYAAIMGIACAQSRDS
jgi:O-antigen ligase